MTEIKAMMTRMMRVKKNLSAAGLRDNLSIPVWSFARVPHQRRGKGGKEARRKNMKKERK